MAVPTFISASTGSEASALSVTVNRPSGLTGRTLLRMYCSAQAAASVWNTPSGWTQVDTGNTTAANPFGYAVFERIIADATALGSEPTSYAVGIAGATNRSLQVGIAAYGSFADSPQGAHAKTHDGDTQSTTIPMPDITTTGANSVICRAAFGGAQATLGSGQYIDASSSPLNARKRFEAQAASSLRPHAMFDEEQASPGAAGVENATQNESLVHVGMSTEILELVPIETLRPTATRNVTGLTPNTDPSAYQTIDDDPDSGGTDFLTGTDPSGTPPDIQRITGADNTGNPTTSTSVTVPTVQVDDIILVSVTNGDGTAQPTISDNSGVGSWTNGTGGGVVRHQAGTAMAGTVFWKRITNAGSESGAVVSLSGMTGSTCANVGVWRGCVTSGSPVDGSAWGEGNASADNAMTGITTATDGARVILNVFYSDNTAVTTNMATATSPGALTKHTEIYSSGGNDSGLATASAVKTTAGATGAFTWAPGTNQISASIGFALKPHFVAGSTTNTKVEAIMDNPVNTLATGTATGGIRIQVKKLGSGSNPTVKAEIHENASGTVLATAISDTSVSDTTSDGVVLSGTFNQNVITNPANVEVWVIGTGASGGLVEIGAVEWNATYVESGAPTPIALAATSTGVVLLRRSPSLSVKATGASVPLLRRSPSLTLKGTSTGVAKIARMVALSVASVSTGVGSLRMSVARRLAATSTGAAAIAASKSVIRALGAVSTGVAALSRTVSRSLPATSSGVSSLSRVIPRPLAALSVGAAAILRSIGRRIPATSTGVGALAFSKSVIRTLAATSTGVASMVRLVSLRIPSTSVGVAALRRVITLRLGAVSTGVGAVVRSISLRLASTSVGVAALTSTKSVIRTLAATSTGVASMRRTLSVALAPTSAGVAALRRSASLRIAATSSGVASIVRSISLRFATTPVGVAALGVVTDIERTLQAVSVGVARVVRSVSRPIAAQSVGSASLRRSPALRLGAVSTGVAALRRTLALRLASTSVGAALITATKSVLRSLAATSVGVAALRRTPGKTLAAVSTGVAALKRNPSLALRSVSVGVGSVRRTLSTRLAASSVGVAAISLSRAFARSLGAVSVGVATLRRSAALRLGATSLGVSGLRRNAALRLQGVSVGVGSVSRRIFWRMGAVASGIPRIVLEEITSHMRAAAFRLGHVLTESRIGQILLESRSEGVAGESRSEGVSTEDRNPGT